MLQEVRVVIIEEFRFMRDLMASVVRAIPDFNLICQTSSLEEALIKLSGAEPQVVLLDMDMPAMREKNAITSILKIYPSVNILCTSQRWDETDVRLIIQAGAKGYLMKPFSSEELLQAIKAFEGNPLLPVSEIITVISPKGNSGKTTLAVNLALGIQQETGHKVGLMDADLQFGDIPVFLNIDPTVTIVEANRDINSLSPSVLVSYLTAYNKNIKVLAAPRSPALAELISTSGTLSILKYMRSLFRYVIVDTASGLQEDTIAIANASNRVYLNVAYNSVFDLDHLRQSVEFLRSLNFPQEKVRIVLSRIKTRGSMDIFNRLREELFYPISALLPNQFQVATDAINGGVPLLTAKPNTDLALGILGIAKDMAESAKRSAKLE
ncbi:MAG: response regulator receiver protein [Firmicutes bacterium]|nr:response regulator receiver protein [Bacillota bacterium]